MLIREDTYICEDKNNTEEKTNDVKIIISHNNEGQTIIGAVKEKREYYFNSHYKDDDMVEAWCNQHDVSHYRTIAVVFGIANGAYIRELHKKNDEMIILVYEPSRDIFEQQYNMQNINDIIEDDKIIVAVGKERYIYAVMASILDYEVIKYTKLFVTPNYDVIFEKELKKFYESYIENANRLIVSRNTIRVFGRNMTKNAANNLLDCVKQYSVYNLKEEFDKLDKSKIPAIIVAAGPSLDKNINDLKKAKGKAFIIAVDTALKPLANAGILPDIAVTVDHGFRQRERIAVAEQKSLPVSVS